MKSCPICPASAALPFLFLAFAGVMLFRSMFAGAAPTPAMFEKSVSLDSAIATAETSGKPVFAVATADWCAPCQSYKRSALADERVQAWVNERAEPVFIDVDEDQQAAQRLGVRSIPATYLIRDGEVVSSFAGAASADSLLQWLEKNSGDPAPTG